MIVETVKAAFTKPLGLQNIILSSSCSIPNVI